MSKKNYLKCCILFKDFWAHCTKPIHCIIIVSYLLYFLSSLYVYQIRWAISQRSCNISSKYPTLSKEKNKFHWRNSEDKWQSEPLQGCVTETKQKEQPWHALENDGMSGNLIEQLFFTWILNGKHHHPIFGGEAL